MKEILKFVSVTTLLILIVNQKTATKANEGEKIELNSKIDRDKYGRYRINVDLNRERSRLSKSLDIKSRYVTVNGTLWHRLIISEPSDYQQKPPLDYTMYKMRGHKFYYKFYDKVSSYNQAKAKCESDNAHLAIVNSREEAGIIRHLYSMNRKIMHYAWVGFHDINYEGKYFTVLGAPIEKTGYVYWAYGQPDNPGFEKCGAIDRNGYFHNMKCESLYPFFCEYEEDQVTFS